MRAVGDSASDVTESQLQGASIQAALSHHGAYWADAAARGAQTGMQQGETGYQADTGFYYTYIGGSWRRSGVAFTQSYTPSINNTGTQPGFAPLGWWYPTSPYSIFIHLSWRTDGTYNASPVTVSLPSGLTNYTPGVTEQSMPAWADQFGTGARSGSATATTGASVITPVFPSSADRTIVAALSTSNTYPNQSRFSIEGQLFVNGL